MRTLLFSTALVLTLSPLAAQTSPTAPVPAASPKPAPAPQATPTPAPAPAPVAPRDENLPPSEAQAKAALEKSPRHGEYVDVKMPSGGTPIRTWIVYPERKDKAGVVIVIHEIFGLTDWIRGVADQLAKEGFIAVAPDLVSGLGPNGGGTESVSSRDDVVELVRGITPDEATARLNAVRDYAVKLPAANGKTATVGFCWGGGRSFAYAAPSRPWTPPSSTTAPPPRPRTSRRSRRRSWATTAATTRGSNATIATGRSRDEEARQDLRASHLRRRRPRLPARPGGPGRREPQGHAGRLAADSGVFTRKFEVDRCLPSGMV